MERSPFGTTYFPLEQSSSLHRYIIFALISTSVFTRHQPPWNFRCWHGTAVPPRTSARTQSGQNGHAKGAGRSRNEPNAIGQSQTSVLISNPAGSNVIRGSYWLRSEEPFMRTIAMVFAGTLIAASAFAEEKPVQLKQAPGLDQVEAHCGACHSLDYIQMNSPFMTSAVWDAEIAKMINAFGAPISEADVKIIAEYLKANYADDGTISAKQFETSRQPPTPQLGLQSAPADRKKSAQKSSMKRKAVSGRSAGQGKKRSATVVRPPSRANLGHGSKTRRAPSPSWSARRAYPGSYGCRQSVGCGCQTPCGWWRWRQSLGTGFGRSTR